MSTVKIYTSLPDASLADDTADATIRQEQTVRNGAVIETINRNLVAESGEMGDAIKDAITGRIKGTLDLTDVQPVYVDVIQIGESGKEFRSKGWMRPDEVL